MMKKKGLIKSLLKSIGRPAEDYNSKREAFYEMISSGKIKAPKSQTLEFYKIDFDEPSSKYTLLDED